MFARNASSSNSRVVERDDVSGVARLAAAEVHLEVAQGDHVLGRGPSLVRRRMARTRATSSRGENGLTR